MNESTEFMTIQDILITFKLDTKQEMPFWNSCRQAKTPNINTIFTKYAFDHIEQQQRGAWRVSEPIRKLFKWLAQVDSMKFKPEQKSIRSFSHQ